MEKRFKRIEKYVNLSNNSPENIDDIKPVSYQAEVSVDLEWGKVICWCFPKLKTNKEAWDFVDSLQEDSELKLDLNKGAGLFQKDFQFVEFYDGVSGLNPVWSYHSQGFTDDLEVKGWVLGDWGNSMKIRNKFPDNRIHRLMVISPSFIGFRSDLPDGYMGDKDKISQFPYHSVINFFANFQKNSDKIGLEPGNSMVKKFPEKLQQIFDKYQIKYDPSGYEDYGCGVGPKKELVKSKWLEEKGIELYQQRMKSHTFKTPYYTVTIRLKFFSPDDR
jgi:hypothetical protein